MRKLGIYLLAATAASLSVSADEKGPVIHLSSKGFAIVQDSDTTTKQSLVEEAVTSEPIFLYEEPLSEQESVTLDAANSSTTEVDQESGATIYPDFISDEIQDTSLCEENVTMTPELPICCPSVEMLPKKTFLPCPTPQKVSCPPAAVSSSSWFDDLVIGISAELLYWASGPDQQIAITGDNANRVATRNFQTFDNNYMPGFRIGYNYALACEPWQIGFIYTYAHDTNQINFGADNFTDWATPQNPTSGTSLYTDWTFNLNQADLIVGRELFYKSYRSFCSVGARYFRYNDGFKNYYSNGSVPSNDISMLNSLQAGGLVVGLDNRYCFDCGLFVDGNMKAGLVLGRIHLNYLGIRRDDVVPPTLIGVQSSFLSLSMIPVIDAAVNIGWNFCLGSIDFTGHVGYEYHVWVNGFRAVQTAIGDPVAFNANMILPSNLFAHGVSAGLAMQF